MLHLSPSTLLPSTFITTNVILNKKIENRKLIKNFMSPTNKGALDGQFSIDHTMTRCSKKLNLNSKK